MYARNTHLDDLYTSVLWSSKVRFGHPKFDQKNWKKKIKKYIKKLKIIKKKNIYRYILIVYFMVGNTILHGCHVSPPKPYITRVLLVLKIKIFLIYCVFHVQ